MKAAYCISNPLQWSTFLIGTFVLILFLDVEFAFASEKLFSTPSSYRSKDYDFDGMLSLIRRLDVIEHNAPNLLQGFYDPRLRSFSIQPETGSQQRVCVTSTCYALMQLTISRTYGVSTGYDDIITYDSSEEDDSKIPILNVMHALLQSPFREGDLFQVPLLAYSVLLVDKDRSIIQSVAKTDSFVASKVKMILAAVLEAAPDRKLGSNQIHSDYVIYQVCKLIAVLQDYASKNDEEEGFGGLPPGVLPDDMASHAFWVLLSAAEVSCNEVCRQLAYRAADDSSSFDVMRLAYSLLTYVRSTSSLSGMAGKETVKGQGPSLETKVPSLNQKLVTAALAVFFAEQNKDGMWDKGQPIYKSLSKENRRDMGNAFIFPVNVLGSLLCMLPAEAFRPHLAALDLTLQWIEAHQRSETIPDYCDDKTGIVYGKLIRGWSSPHLNPNSGPRAWPTAQVLKCTYWMRETIRELLHHDVLDEFHGTAFSKQNCTSDMWDNLLDTDLGSPNDEECRTIKDVLHQRVIKPFASSIENPSYGAAYSAILFGPPGGAKTSITEALAQRMGYDYVRIDTADFLADGLTNVAARIRYVFTRLMALKKCVILFDEIEEFALDRKRPGLTMESRMLTTAMLTAINDLRRTQQSIFFIATNRLHAFDSAITRPGRFDMTLFIGTPNLESRITQLKQQLVRVRVGDEQIEEESIRTYRQFLESVWSETAMFMNYLEGVQFASACADKVAATKKALTIDQMSAILKKQAAVMTVRGPAREEYISSMAMSRF
eukprot:scaffold8079_cov121-Cylindrotheca_fusiformis.AAC.6